MNALLYCRVSTLEQAKEGYSIEAQKESMQKYAEAMGYSIFDTIIDDGFSGKNLDRPGIQKVIKIVQQKLINVVIIYKLDRLSRSVKNVLELVELLEKYNVTLFSLNENLDLSSPFGRAALKMSATFSELERETIVERMTMGKLQRVKNGLAMRPFLLPIGYEYDEKTKMFTPHPQEAEQVKIIYDLYLKGWNMAKISTYMHNNYKNRYGSYNDRTAAGKVLSNPFCAGYFYYNGEMYKGKNIEPIIDFETWLKAQARRLQVKKNHQRTSSPYLLTGLIYCGVCGNRYVSKKYDRKVRGKHQPFYEYHKLCYGCVTRVKHDPKYHDLKCTNDIIPQDILNKIVEDSIKNLKFTKFKNAEIANGALNILHLEISELKSKIEKLLDLYEDNLITKEQLQDRVDKINKEIKEKEKLMKEQSQNIVERPIVDLEKLKKRISNWDALKLEEKRRYIPFLIKKIIIKDKDNIDIDWLVE